MKLATSPFLRVLAAGAVVAPALIAAACTTTDVSIGRQCRSGSDCSSNEACVSGVCQTGSTTGAGGASTSSSSSSGTGSSGTNSTGSSSTGTSGTGTSTSTGSAASTSSASSSGGTDGGGSCGTATCTAGQVCVSNQTQGGAIITPDDAGMCPAGDADFGDAGRCEQIPVYHCAAIPAACTSGVTCGCAGSLCEQLHICISASSALVECVLEAP